MRIVADEILSPPGRDEPNDYLVNGPIVITLTPLLLTIRQVAVIVGISERKLRGMISAGQFPKPVKGLGRMSRWKRSEIEAWVASLS